MLNGYAGSMSLEDRKFLEHAVNYRSASNKLFMLKEVLYTDVPLNMKRDLMFKLLTNMY